MHVIPIAPERVADAVTFLEERTDTALFLLSNLASYGPALGSAPYSGDFKGIVDHAGRLIAVFCLTRRGVMIIDTHGRSDLAPTILGACESTGIPIDAVIGERRAADSVWPFVKGVPGFQVTWESPERLYRLDLGEELPPNALHVARRVRFLLPGDFPAWNDANLAYLAEVGMSLSGTTAERRDTFDEQVAQRRWWGLFDDGGLVTTAALNAVYKDTAQVGAVYTVPDRRGQGLSRATMATLIADAREHHHLRQLVLFTGESNHVADRLYRGLGFEVVGEYGVYFGTRRT
jgi:GNAT superfamily N-acetyltransferase